MNTFMQHCIVLMAFLLLSVAATAQSPFFDSLDVNAGLSSTDHFNIGTRYRFNQNNIGLNIGGVPRVVNHNYNLVVVSLTYYRHLWGVSEFSHQHPWYVKPGIHYMKSTSQLTRYNRASTSNVEARLYLGRDFNITTDFGISLALGPTLRIYDRFYNQSEGHYPFSWYGGFDLLFYYRVKS